jgi:adenosylmethionine-8-amino-7-oxononanoate aminotransferase
MGEICFKIIRQGDVMGVSMELTDPDMMTVGIALSGGHHSILSACAHMKLSKQRY